MGVDLKAHPKGGGIPLKKSRIVSIATAKSKYNWKEDRAASIDNRSILHFDRATLFLNKDFIRSTQASDVFDTD
jgi:hypothetical protein